MSDTTTMTVAHKLGAFRCCEHGGLIAWRAHMETTGPRAVELILAAAAKAGAVERGTYPICRNHFAVLELFDIEGIDIIDDRCIPDRAAWEWWRKAAEMRTEASTCRVCAPEAVTVDA